MMTKVIRSMGKLISSKSAVTVLFFFSGQLTLPTPHISTRLQDKDFPFSRICHIGNLVEICFIFKFGLGGPDCLVPNLSTLLCKLIFEGCDAYAFLYN